MCECVCVWRRTVLWNSACRVMLLEPPFRRCMTSTHTPTHFLSTLPWLSSFTCTISESFPLSKSFYFQLFFQHTVLKHPEQTGVCYAIRIPTWENMTLDKKECCYIHVQNKAAHSCIYYFTASITANTPHMLMKLVIQCHRASCLFALKMLHKVV